MFGFAQSIEAASSPISAFMIGPLAQFMIVPFVASEAGRQQLGWLLGEGMDQSRGIALVFIIASLLMAVVLLFAFRSKAYRVLSAFYQKT